MDLSLVSAAKRYKISKEGLRLAVKRGVLPAFVIQTSELRVKSKDVEAYLKTVAPWRQENGRRGGLKGGFAQMAADRRRRQRAAAS